MTAADIMTREVITVRSAAPVDVALDLMRSHAIKTLIVQRLHAQDAYGIVTDHDVVEKVFAQGKDPRNVRVFEIMNKPCLVVNPDLAVEYVARLLVQFQVRCAPVISETLLGVVSFRDLIHHGHFQEPTEQTFLQTQLQTAIAQAQTLEKTTDPQAADCLQAWQRVEAIEAELAYLQGKPLSKTAFEHYLDQYPQAWDDDLLGNWCSG